MTIENMIYGQVIALLTDYRHERRINDLSYCCLISGPAGGGSYRVNVHTAKDDSNFVEMIG